LSYQGPGIAAASIVAVSDSTHFLQLSNRSPARSLDRDNGVRRHTV